MNGDKLYWQYNCRSIWLTLQTTKNKKIIIDHVDTAYHSFAYRLGYNLIKEFNNSLLFSSRCPANGPCNYVLVDKNSGRIIRKFNVLINEPRKGYELNFVAYLPNLKNYIVLYFPDSKKQLQIPIDKNGLFWSTPEYQFEEIQIKDNTAILTYETSRSQDKSVRKTKTIDIGKYIRHK